MRILACAFLSGMLAASSSFALTRPGTMVTSPVSSTVSPGVAPSSTLISPPAVSSSTLFGAAAVSSTLLSPSAVSSTVSSQVPASEPVPPPPSGPKPPSFDELHKRTTIAMAPSGYSAHVGGATGENLSVFLSWYIGTLYNERGLYIAPIFSLFIGADGKWSFIEETHGIPAVAAGYFGGFGLPFTGGSIKTTGVAKQKQAFLHDVYGAMSKKFGPLTVSGGVMYGLKKAFPVFLPMLRNSSFTDQAVTPSKRLTTLFGGVDFAVKEQHFKVEVLTLPDEFEARPWLVQTHIDGFLGFDIAWLKDSLGYEVIGYYLLPFFRWPDKKALDKETERMAAKKR